MARLLIHRNAHNPKRKPKPLLAKVQTQLEDEMIKITLEYTNLEDAILAMANLRGTGDAPALPATAAATPTKDKKADTKVTAGKSATTAANAAGQPAAADGPKDAAEKKGPESSGSATVDAYEPVGAMIKELVKTHRAQVLAVLNEFGVPNGKELKPEQYAPFMEKLTAATTPAADLG